MNIVAPAASTLFLAVYLFGVVVALLTIDARGPARVGLALLWPVGPMAFVVTISILILALPIAYPILGTIVVGLLIAAVAFAWRCGTATGL
jgi:hypothetical protein